MIKQFINRVVLSLLLGILPGSLWSQILFREPLSKRVTDYDITAQLDPETKVINGKMTLVWKNHTSDSVTELQMHLYMNAFKNTKSSFIKERGGIYPVPDGAESENIWGWTDILMLRIKDGENLTSKIQFIAPDDNNYEDQTVIRIPLTDTIVPGQSITLEIDFISKLPRIVARSGYTADFFLVGQWFPKMGVYEQKGTRLRETSGWNCHQYHSNSEFYSDFGNYTVKIILPRNYQVGATGILLDEKPNNDGTKELKFRAEDVVDFAWTASPRFIVTERKWKDINIKCFMQPEHTDVTERHFEAAIKAFEYFEKYLGKFPYPQISIIDPPMYASAAGGMEYPMFITTLSLKGLPDGLRLSEMVTIHELGHNYFMGILANNETEEAWLDEGFNTYYEMRILDEVYGANTSLVDWMGLKMGAVENHRDSYVHHPKRKTSEIARFSYEQPAGTYGVMSYSKPGLVLLTLDRMVGRETMDTIMKTYFNRWKFNHPCTRDFTSIVNEVVNKRHGKEFGTNLNWYFQQTIYGTDDCDYSVSSIRNTLNSNGEQGVFDKSGTKVTLFETNTESDTYHSTVNLLRLGEITLPVDVLIKFENGDEITEKWDGVARYKIFEYQKNSKVVSVLIDPEMKIPLDINRLNNSSTIEPDTLPLWKYVVKFLFWVQNIIQSVTYFA